MELFVTFMVLGGLAGFAGLGNRLATIAAIVAVGWSATLLVTGGPEALQSAIQALIAGFLPHSRLAAAVAIGIALGHTVRTEAVGRQRS